MKYPHIISAVHRTPWMIREEKLREILAFIDFKANGGQVSADDAAVLVVPTREPFLVACDGMSELQAGAVSHGASEGKDDSSAWDGPAAVERLRKWASSDGSGDKDKMEWAKYRRGFAWYDASNEDSFGSYKLPHHDIKDGKFVVVLRGVEAAMSALLGGRGGTAIPDGDRKAVYDHLAAEYREFGKEPPPFHGEALRRPLAADNGGNADDNADSRMTAGAAGYMELTGAVKDNDCREVNVPGGVSTELGCCNEFEPLDGADEFECGMCENVVTPESMNDADDAQPGAGQALVTIQAANAEANVPGSASRSRAGAIAVLPLQGTISHRMGLMSQISGGTSTEQFSGWLRAALSDPQVKSIVIDIDSPGGTVTGVQELADEIFQARQQKPVIAVANGMAASAAYYLGSQASELVVSPSGEVGSIGVFAAHEDVSKALEGMGVKTTFISAGKYKTEGNPYEPLSGEARDAMQAKVDAYYQQFVNAVARGRNTSADTVQSDFGQGRMLMAAPARKAGMVDRIATLDQTLKRLGARSKAKVLPSAMNREAATVEAPPQATQEPAYLADLARRRKELDLHQ